MDASSGVISVINTLYSTLATYVSTCVNTDPASGSCKTAIRRYCVTSGYQGGFGPLEHYGDSVTVACVGSSGGESVNTTFTALQAFAPNCSGSNALSLDCNLGSHLYCQSQGYGSGLGPFEYYQNSATILCMDANHIVPQQQSFTALQTISPNCNVANSLTDNCMTAIHRNCESLNFSTGYAIPKPCSPYSENFSTAPNFSRIFTPTK